MSHIRVALSSTSVDARKHEMDEEFLQAEAEGRPGDIMLYGRLPDTGSAGSWVSFASSEVSRSRKVGT